MTALAQKFVGLLVREDTATAVRYFDTTSGGVPGRAQMR